MPSTLPINPADTPLNNYLLALNALVGKLSINESTQLDPVEFCQKYELHMDFLGMLAQMGFLIEDNSGKSPAYKRTKSLLGVQPNQAKNWMKNFLKGDQIEETDDQKQQTPEIKLSKPKEKEVIEKESKKVSKNPAPRAERLKSALVELINKLSFYEFREINVDRVYDTYDLDWSFFEVLLQRNYIARSTHQKSFRFKKTKGFAAKVSVSKLDEIESWFEPAGVETQVSADSITVEYTGPDTVKISSGLHTLEGNIDELADRAQAQLDAINLSLNPESEILRDVDQQLTVSPDEIDEVTERIAESVATTTSEPELIASVNSEAEYEEAIQRIHQLMLFPYDDESPESKELNTLIKLVEGYEFIHYTLQEPPRFSQPTFYTFLDRKHEKVRYLFGSKSQVQKILDDINKPSGDTPDAVETSSQNTPNCAGDCGMNYCDEYGCIERDRHYVKHPVNPDPVPPIGGPLPSFQACADCSEEQVTSCRTFGCRKETEKWVAEAAQSFIVPDEILKQFQECHRNLFKVFPRPWRFAQPCLADGCTRQAPCSNCIMTGPGSVIVEKAPEPLVTDWLLRQADGTIVIAKDSAEALDKAHAIAKDDEAVVIVYRPVYLAKPKVIRTAEITQID